MSNKGKYYLTTAIAYTSGKPHIGNVYEIVLADAIARFKRMEGYDVFFQTGTDEHGQKNELKAEAEGVTPKEFVDKVAAIIKEQFDLMNVSYDHFIRTTDDYHEKEVQKIFKYLYDKGDIYKGAYEGLYCNRQCLYLTVLSQHKGRQKIIIPDPHTIQDCNSSDNRLQQRENNAEENSFR